MTTVVVVQLENVLIVLCRLVVSSSALTAQLQCRVFSPQSMHFPIVWCAVYIHFALQSTICDHQNSLVSIPLMGDKSGTLQTIWGGGVADLARSADGLVSGSLQSSLDIFVNTAVNKLESVLFAPLQGVPCLGSFVREYS